ncbi:hypothetical protein FQN57_004126, partial [Myotisia sp. PD_48]
MKRVYDPILKHILNPMNENESMELKKQFRDIVGVIILLATPLPVDTLGPLLDLPARKISFLLNKLHSILRVPQNGNLPVRMLHLSFREFLVDKSSIFHVDEKETHGSIATHCLRVMGSKLKHNICDLASYGTKRTDINDQVIRQNISADLEYSCRYWVYHLQKSEGCISYTKVLSFFREHFLHWLEALSIIGIAAEAITIINALKSDRLMSTSIELSEFLYEAMRFTLKNTYIASIAPLQLYCSGLAFSPMESIIKKTFLGGVSKRILTLPQVEDLWSPLLQTLEDHSGPVYSVAISHDGQTVASSSDDKTIKLWDART